MGQGLMALDCHEMKKQGKTLEEVAAYLEENKLCYHQIATVETLDYLKKAGRVKAAAAFFGNIFGVKPMIISDAIGQNYAIKKMKGRRNSLVEIVNMAKENLTNLEEQTIYVKCDIINVYKENGAIHPFDMVGIRPHRVLHHVVRILLLQAQPT
jgi:fatty acid-binding protein DegV